MLFFKSSSTPPDVASLRENGDAMGLVRALKYKKDPVIRAAAADGLGAKFDFKAIGQWASLGLRMVGLQNVAPSDRGRTVADSFKPYLENRPAKVLSALTSALGDTDAAVRAGAAKALGRMWCKPGTLKAYSGNVIRFLQPYEFAQIERSVVAVRSDASALQALLGRLQDGDAAVRSAAVEALKETREAAAVSGLARAEESDPDTDIREAAGRAVEMLAAIANRERSGQ
jgi:HEAT repeat protein